MLFNSVTSSHTTMSCVPGHATFTTLTCLLCLLLLQGSTLLRLPYSLARCRPGEDGEIDDRMMIPDADMCRMFDSSINIMIEVRSRPARVP